VGVGPADAGAFHRIAGYLEPDYTVVTYDPRGLSHSPLDGPVRDDRIVRLIIILNEPTPPARKGKDPCLDEPPAFKVRQAAPPPQA